MTPCSATASMSSSDTGRLRYNDGTWSKNVAPAHHASALCQKHGGQSLTHCAGPERPPPVLYSVARKIRADPVWPIQIYGTKPHRSCLIPLKSDHIPHMREQVSNLSGEKYL